MTSPAEQLPPATPSPPSTPVPRRARWAVATGALSLAEVVAVVVEAEAAGCEAALVGEGTLEADAVVAASAALAATRRIRVGPAMVSALERHPVALARAAASLDRRHPARVLLGVGRGERPDAEGALGLRWERGTAALADTLQICSALLAGREARHRGERWSANLDPLPERAAASAPIPLILAAVGESTLRLAGAAADAVALNYGASSEYIAWAVEQVVDGAAAAGRDPALVDVLGYVLVARTDAHDADQQVDAVRRTLTRLLRVPGQGAALLAPLGLPPGTPLDDHLLGRLAAIGDSAEVRERIEALRRAGLRCPVLLPTGLRALLRGSATAAVLTS